jgi:hypothetical protein
MPYPTDWSQQADLLRQAMAVGDPIRPEGTVLHAQAIRHALLECARSGDQPDPQGLNLIDATIQGVVDLSYFSISVPLRFANCLFHDHLIADSASLSVLRLVDCEFLTSDTAIRAQALTASGDVIFDGLTAAATGDSSAVNIAAASIGKDLVITRADLKTANGTALDLGAVAVKGSVDIKDVTAQTSSEGLTVWLNNGKIDGRLIFDTATLTSGGAAALVAESLTVGGDVELRGFIADTNSGDDTCTLAASKIGGTLTLRDARITSRHGTALNAERIEIGGDATFSDSFEAYSGGLGECAVNLAGAKIRGRLSLARSRLGAKHGKALDAAQIAITRSAVFNTTHATGGMAGIELGSATIGSHLLFDGAQLDATHGPALTAERMHVAGQASFRNGFRASTTSSADTAAVALGGAKIGSQLDLTGAELNNIEGTTLAADSIAVAADMFLDDLHASAGFQPPIVRLVNARIGAKLDCRAFDVDQCVSQLNLMHADAGTLRLNATYGGNNSRWLILDGLTYTGIPSDDMNLDQWIDTLKHRTVAYSPQPWHQLGMAHNAIGHDQEARRILIEQRVDYRNRMLTAPPEQKWFSASAAMLRGRRAVSRFLQFFTGYGYRSHRAFLLLLTVAALAVGLTTLAGQTPVDSHRPTKPRFVAQQTTPTANAAPCSLSEQIGLGLQIGLPLIKTAARDRCRLDTASLVGQTFTYASWVLQALAWVFATLAVAGYTGLIRKL